jgi:hypothetical protein
MGIQANGGITYGLCSPLAGVCCPATRLPSKNVIQVLSASRSVGVSVT